MPEIKGLQQGITANRRQGCCATSKELVSHGAPIPGSWLPKQDTGEREGKSGAAGGGEAREGGKRGWYSEPKGSLDEADSDRMGRGEECSVSVQLPPWDQ